MSRHRTDRLALGIANRCLALAWPDGRPGGSDDFARLQNIGDASNDSQAASWKSALASMLNRIGGTSRTGLRRLDVVAGDFLGVHWVVAPPAGVASMAELEALTLAQLSSVAVGPAQDWHVRADWRADRPFMCAAIHRPLVDALLAVAAEFQIRLHLSTTLGKALMIGSSWLPGDGWSVLQQPSRLSMMHTSAGAIQLVREVQVESGTSASDCRSLAEAEVRRECLRLGEPEPRQISWMSSPDQAAELQARGHAAGQWPIKNVQLPMQRPGPQASTSSEVASADWCARLAIAV